MNFLGKMKTPNLRFSKPRGADRNPEAIAHRDGETSGGGEEAPPPTGQMDIIAAAGGEGGSDERTLQTTSSGDGERKLQLMVKPPTDDVCPICFDNFDVPCRGPCGHWYCGGCILQYWNYSTGFRSCRCPMCLKPITKLTPEASLCHRREVDISKVLRGIDDYNRLFVWDIKGLMRKALAIPLWYLKRLFGDIMDPDRPNFRFLEVQMVTLFFFGIIYSSIPFDFLQIENPDWDIKKLSDYFGIALVLILYFVSLFLRWWRNRNAREVMVIQAE